MIQLNLLPDVKLEYISAQRRKRTVVGLSLIISAAFLAIFVFLLLFVRVGQTKHIRDLTGDIETTSAQLTDNRDINKILTIQNQLNSLSGLHDQKIISSRLFDYLSQLTPNEATISDIEMDFLANTMVITGNAKDLSVVNKFADTLKFTKYELKGQPATQEDAAPAPDTGLESAEPTAELDPAVADPAAGTGTAAEIEPGKAFSGVVLSSFSLTGEGLTGGLTGGEAAVGDVSYELTLNFNREIFASIGGNPKDAVKLIVPKIISTRSEVEKPTDLFKEQPPTGGEAN